MIYSNIIDQEKTREIQAQALSQIAAALKKSYGPMGSHTGIVRETADFCHLDYTKDGHSIVKAIKYMNPIERSVQDLLTELTRYIVKEVGDGTTSAILICDKIFDELISGEFDSMYPSDIVAGIHEIIEAVSVKIMERAKKCTLEDIKKISLISTNNNEYMAKIITDLYEELGMKVYIDVLMSNTENTFTKKYDGMTIDTGFTNICFINNPSKNSAGIENPRIYTFMDPIDTPEMLTFLDRILSHNIYEPLHAGKHDEMIPTVILAKKITPDANSMLTVIVNIMKQYPATIPLLIIPDIKDDWVMDDITTLCGGNIIKKYLSSEIQELQQKQKLAPTIENIIDYCNTAEYVEADSFKTKFIKPAKMYNEDGSLSTDFTSILDFVENEIVKAKEENEGITYIGKLKKRLHSLNGAMAEIIVGGITESDKENLKASVEDAVLNCRSAATYGCGYAANFMTLSVLKEMEESGEFKDNKFLPAFVNAFTNLSDALFGSAEITKSNITNGQPMNIRTKQYDGSVLASIKTDIVILDTIDKILSLMFTCNQYLVQSPMHATIYNETTTTTE